MSRRQHANPRVQALIDSATEAGASPEMIDFLIPGWESSAPQTVEERVREELHGPAEKQSEPTPPSFTEAFVRDKMLHPEPAESSTLITPNNPEESERRIRRSMNLPPNEQEDTN